MPSFKAYVRFWVRALAARRHSPVKQADEAPLRAPLLTAEQMERQGRVLARAHVVSMEPAPDRLLDNVYLIEEQIHLARRHFPKGYSRELPRLTSGPSAGFPRVYDIALSAISHGDGRVDGESLARFVAAYQRVTPL